MMERHNQAGDRLRTIRARMAIAAQAAGRSAADVALVAVTKTYDAEAILPAIEAGQLIFGENRVQEAKAKWPPLRETHPDIELHLIGPLQSNKTREAVALFDVIHTLDRPKIAQAIAGESAAQGRRPRLFIQVNTGREAQKAGIAPEDTRPFLTQCRDAFGLDVVGLMCIPPVDAAPEVHFGLLAQLAADLGLAQLSMGMSADFETAIRLGATHVRIGSAIFGERI